MNDSEVTLWEGILKGTTVISRKNELTGKKNLMLVRQPIDKMNAGVSAWIEGKVIQAALPFLSATEREFVMTGLTEQEQAEFYPVYDDDQE